MHPLLEEQLHRQALDEDAMTPEFKNFLGTVDIAYHRFDLERLRSEDIQACHHRVLEMIATGSPLNEILAHLSLAVESQVPGLLCSFMVLDSDGRHLRPAVAPSFPKERTLAIDGLSIDAASDPDEFDFLAPGHTPAEALLARACELARPDGASDYNSVPIVDHRGTVLGAFAAYRREAVSPGSDELTTFGRASRLAGIAIARHQADVARRDVENRLQQAERTDAVGQFVGSIVHDFNNLLTAVHGFVSIIGDGGLSSDDEEEVLRETRQTLERASALLKQLLKFSHGEPICLRNIDLNEVMADMTPLLKHVSGPRIALLTPPPAAVAGVFADKVMLEQILLNLALNARDAMSGSGTLDFRTAIVTLGDEEARRRPGALAGTFVRLSVRDTGCGIPPGSLARIFEPHFTTKAPGKGTGLGLATVFRIVEELHGWIEVESEVGPSPR